MLNLTGKNFDHLPSRSVSKIGTSFSLSYAGWLENTKQGESWLKTADRIAKLPFSSIRIPIQWNSVETELGYDFQAIDSAIAYWSSKKVEIVLVMGLKNLRWPEYHVPTQYAHFLKNKHVVDDRLDPQFIAKLFDYLEACLDRYGKDSRITMIQVENEPFELSGKDGGLRIAAEFLKRELDFVRQRTNKPILLTEGAGMAEPCWLARMQRPKMIEQLIALKPDQIGLNIYQSGRINLFHYPYSFSASERHWRLAKRLVDQIKQTAILPVITELQAEPWESDPASMLMDGSDFSQSFKPEDLVQIWERATKLDVAAIYWWGLEFQAACASKHNNNEVWLEKIRKLISK